ncbi:BCS1 N terminal-domain-containing protein [Hygrophoropsis aurantiaca]|uniref:BCS1 N terminal-domain-containing protein n=1 Tax=Hygrophoropsis aurantiaca TaxID=72124 RepID=A0ACB8AFR7_9AGAM|nr:BCS1 N terminal-domain-containing protein [Hygrophoropsis aurantiaca]
MSVGVGLTVLRQGLVFGSTALRRRMLVSLEVNNKDRAYEWFLTWMAHQANTASKTRRTNSWLRSHELSVETSVEQRSNGSTSVLFKLVAGPGIHWFKYQGAWMQMKRERETRSMQLMSGVPWETVTLTALSRDRTLFPKLLAEARDLAMRDQEGKLIIRTAWGIEWKQFGLPRRKRPLSSVVFAEGIAQKVEHDIKAFLQRRQWYADRGIPYRRGYLLHGPPGSGKTSFIQALAGSLSYDICVLNLSERGLTDDKLNHLLSNAPERSFVLIEDVDAAFNKRVQTSEDGYQSSVTFSGFLNALDGVASGEERIIFMTTNHVERLDPALIRPGRVDLNVLVDDASPAQAKTLFTQFYGGEENTTNGTEDEVTRLAEQLHTLVEREMQDGRRISMAALQGLFIRSNPPEALKSCQELFINKRT